MSAICFNMDQSKILLSGNGLTLSQTSPGFYVSAVEVFLKTLWEQEKFPMMNKFSFSHSVFYPFGEFSDIFIKL